MARATGVTEDWISPSILLPEACLYAFFRLAQRKDLLHLAKDMANSGGGGRGGGRGEASLNHFSAASGDEYNVRSHQFSTTEGPDCWLTSYFPQPSVSDLYVISDFADTISRSSCSLISSDVPGLFTKSTYQPEGTFKQEYHTPRRDSFAYQLPGSLPSATYREPPLNLLPLSVSDGKAVHYGPEYRDQKRQWEILSHIRNCYEKQNNIGVRRYALRQQRTELRRKRQEVAEQGTDSIGQISLLINKLDLQSEDTACLKRLCEQYQDRRDWYQQLEDDYNETEGSFDLAEFGLEKSERVLQEMVEMSPAHDLTAVFENTKDDESTQSTPDSKPKYHALVYDYLYQCGRANNLREGLWELQTDHEALLNEQELRKNFGLSLGAEALGILGDFKQDVTEILAELERTEKNAQRLKMECDIQGLSIAPLRNVAYNESDESEALIGSLTDIGQLYLWRQNSPKFFEERIVTQESVNIPEFINKWFLHQLCQSSFEILLFRLSPKSQILSFDDDRLRALILDSWEKDVTANANMDMASSHSMASTQLVQVSNGMSASSEGSLLDNNMSGNPPSYFGQHTSSQGQIFNDTPEIPKSLLLEDRRPRSPINVGQPTLPTFRGRRHSMGEADIQAPLCDDRHSRSCRRNSV